MTDKPAQEPSNRVPTGVELTALDPTFRTDPYRVLVQLREREPVHYDDAIKRWVLTRADDIERVVRDRTMAVDGRKANEGTYMRLFAPKPGREPSMIMLDAPDHTRLRSLVNKAFTARRVELWAPRIGQIVDELLDVVTGQESFDLIEAFAGPLPVIVIAEMLGIDPADHRDFKRWSDGTAMSFSPRLTDEQRARIVEARNQLDAYLAARDSPERLGTDLYRGRARCRRGGCNVDRCSDFGLPGDEPVAGDSASSAMGRGSSTLTETESDGCSTDACAAKFKAIVKNGEWLNMPNITTSYP